MKTIVEAKVFKNGGSNAIRIPSSFKIENGTLFLSLDEHAGQIVITKEKPQRLAKFFELANQGGHLEVADWQFERNREPYVLRQSMVKVAGEE